MIKFSLTKLRELASLATPGPWLQSVEEEPRLIASSGGRDSLLGIRESEAFGDEAIVMSHADADFIAMAHPTAVIELIDEIQRLENALMDLRAAAIRKAPDPV